MQRSHVGGSRGEVNIRGTRTHQINIYSKK
jgi:hypothetical protein